MNQKSGSGFVKMSKFISFMKTNLSKLTTFTAHSFFVYSCIVNEFPEDSVDTCQLLSPF